MSEPSQRFYEFDTFLLDAQERVLFRDGQPVDLTPKVFDILFELVQNRGRVVEKKELMEKVWPESFVEESNLTQQISTLRKKLTHGSERERYVMTVPGRGYRFLPTVREWNDDAFVTVHERIRARVVVRREVGPEGPTEQVSERRGESSIIARSSQAEIIQTRSDTALSVPEARKRHRALIPIIIVAVGLSIVVAVFVGPSVYERFTRDNTAPFGKTKLVKFTNTGKTVSAAIAPDGKYIAYAVADGPKGSLWIRQVATSNSGLQVIPPDEFDYVGLTVSPDSNYLYYLGAHGNAPTALYRVPAMGGAPVRLLEDVDTPPAFSPDGKQMAYIRGYPDLLETSLLIANVDGTGERKLTSLKGWRDKFMVPAGPSWSPDGRRIIYPVQMSDDKGEYQTLFEAQVDDGVVKPINSVRWLRVGRVAWLSDGRGLMVVAADLDSALSQVWHVSYPSGEIRKVTNDLDDYSDLTLTANAETVAVVRSNQQANLWIVPDFSSSRARQITFNNYDGIQGLAWTPDGRIVYATMTGPNLNLWITGPDGSHQKPLAEITGLTRGLAVSPDGRYIVFVSTRDGKQHLWRMDSDGSHAQQLTDGVRDLSPAFSPDGEWVVYRSSSFGIPNLFKVPTNGGQPVRLTEKASAAPAVSPDGKLVAIGYREDSQHPLKIALMRFTDGQPVKLLELQEFPTQLRLQWTSDGQAVAYLNTKGGVSNLWSLPVNGDKPTPLTHFDSQRIFWFSVSRDGHRLAVARGQIANDVVLINAIK